MLPPGRDYDEIYRTFRWPVPARYNIGVAVCDRCAEKEPAGSRSSRSIRTDGARSQLRLAARHFEPARQRTCGARHRARRPRRDPAAAVARGRRDPHRGLQARRHRAAARHAVRHRGDLLSIAEFRRQGADHQRARALPRPCAANCRACSWCCRSMGRRRRARLPADAGAASADFTPVSPARTTRQ